MSAAPSGTRPQPDEADELARADAAALAAFVESDGDGRRGGVPVLLDVVVHAVVGQPQRLLHGLIDAQVRLVRDEQIDVAHRHVLLRAKVAHHLRHARHRHLEHRAAVHLRDVTPLADLLLVDERPVRESEPWYVQNP